MILNGVKTKFEKITVDGVAENSYKKGIYQAQLRQTVTTIYPSKKTLIFVLIKQIILL